jgi:hypothetical protein
MYKFVVLSVTNIFYTNVLGSKFNHDWFSWAVSVCVVICRSVSAC